MLSDYFPPHFGGGVERVAIELCEGLVVRGHTVAVITLQTTPAPAVETNGALTVYRVPALDLTRWLGFQFAVSVSVLSTLPRLIRNFKPDIVHAHNLFFRTTEIAAMSRMIFPIPLVTTLHLGKPVGGGKILNTLIRAYESTIGNFIVRRSDHLVAVSNAVAEHAHRIGGDSASVTVIPNGVNINVFYPAPDRNNIGQKVLFVARLVSNKDPETLIRAATLVMARHPQVQFIVVGDGPLRVRLQGQVNQLGIGHAVQFLGLRDDVPELMRQATLFVRPSTLEGMPLTVLEAMASELPVVATPVGGTPELIKDGVNGFLTPVGDHITLANSIIRLLDAPSLAVRMGQRGRELVEASYTWDAVTEQMERVYMEQVGR
ncbi:glycosyltransferase family 4 protein [Chloroflexota bacterium]